MRVSFCLFKRFAPLIQTGNSLFCNSFVRFGLNFYTTVAGGNPLPISDTLLIVPIQITLAAKLANIYGFGLLETSTMHLLQQQIVPLLGKQFASSLTKFIPIAGQIINAGVAGALTYGAGYGLNKLYYSAYENFLNTGEMPNWAKLFKDVDLSSFNFKEMLDKFKQDKQV